MKPNPKKERSRWFDKNILGLPPTKTREIFVCDDCGTELKELSNLFDGDFKHIIGYCKKCKKNQKAFYQIVHKKKK